MKEKTKINVKQKIEKTNWQNFEKLKKSLQESEKKNEKKIEKTKPIYAENLRS